MPWLRLSHLGDHGRGCLWLDGDLPVLPVGIRLVDETGSVQVAAAAMQDALNSLEDVFKRRSR